LSYLLTSLACGAAKTEKMIKYGLNRDDAGDSALMAALSCEAAEFETVLHFS